MHVPTIVAYLYVLWTTWMSCWCNLHITNSILGSLAGGKPSTDLFDNYLNEEHCVKTMLKQWGTGKVVLTGCKWLVKMLICMLFARSDQDHDLWLWLLAQKQSLSEAKNNRLLSQSSSCHMMLVAVVSLVMYTLGTHSISFLIFTSSVFRFLSVNSGITTGVLTTWHLWCAHYFWPLPQFLSDIWLYHNDVYRVHLWDSKMLPVD